MRGRAALLTLFAWGTLECSLPGTAFAGPWTRELGSHYLKLGADLYVTTDYDDARTDSTPSDGSGVQRFVGQTFTLYGEVGLTPCWPLQLTVTVPVSVGQVTFRDTALLGSDAIGKATGTRAGDLRVALQTSLVRDPFQLAVSWEVKAPMYSNDRVAVGLGPFRAWFPLAGDGQIDLTSWLLLGASVPGRVPVWVEGGVGYRHRTALFVGWETDLRFVDGIPAYFAVGVAPAPLWVLARLDALKSVRIDEVTREFVALSGGIGLTVWRGLAVEGRVGGELFARNAPRGFSAGVGLSWRWPHPAAKPTT